MGEWLGIICFSYSSAFYWERLTGLERLIDNLNVRFSRDIFTLEFSFMRCFFIGNGTSEMRVF